MKASRSTLVASFAAAVLLTSCATPAALDPQAQFMDRLSALCGQAFAGRVTTTDAADADMAGKQLVMHVASCNDREVRIPFHVGEDRSRTWVITRTAAGLRLKHDHRHADGSPDAVTMYGGDTAGSGAAWRQEFPVDAESIALFRANGLPNSVTNVWAVEVTDTQFAYELRRPPGPAARHFRVEFDLTRPVPPPAAAVGLERRRAALTPAAPVLAARSGVIWPQPAKGAEPMAVDPEERHYSDEQVSGGSKENVVRWVLGVSLLLIVIAMSLVWIIPALTGR